jgi:hypothetical protein
MAATYDPRSVKEETWVPENAMFSQKSTVFTRGSFSTGTTGFGGIVCTPQPWNDIASVSATSAASVGTAGTILASFTNQVSSTPNGPYASTQCGTSLSGTTGLVTWRVVAQALYIKYAGTELNRGGDMILFEEPNHADSYQYSYNTALALDGAKRVSVTNEWQHVAWLPVPLAGTGAGTSALSETCFSASASTPGRRNLAVFANSAGNPQPFDFEVWSHVEYVGAPARSSSISFNDPIGYAAIVGAGQMFQQLDSVLGIEGYVKSVEAQLNNQSLPRTEPPHANFVGLLPFLPKLAEMVGPVLKGALKGGLMAALPKETRQIVKKAKAKKVLVKNEKLKSKKRA